MGSAIQPVSAILSCRWSGLVSGFGSPKYNWRCWTGIPGEPVIGQLTQLSKPFGHLGLLFFALSIYFSGKWLWRLGDAASGFQLNLRKSPPCMKPPSGRPCGSLAGVSSLRPSGHIGLRMAAVSTAQHRIINLLKTL